MPVVMHLLQSGADVAIETHKGERPLQLATSSEIREIFTSRSSTDAIEEYTLENTDPLPIVPNYLKNPLYFHITMLKWKTTIQLLVLLKFK